MSDNEEELDAGSSPHSLPIATIKKTTKQAVPPALKLSADLTDMLGQCCLEFVEMLFSSANSISNDEKKTTITPEHVLAAIEQLELPGLKAPLTEYLQELQEVATKDKQQSKAKKKTRAEEAGMSEEDQIAMQQAMFAEARAQAAGQY